jgi:hypothetical protein
MAVFGTNIQSVWTAGCQRAEWNIGFRSWKETGRGMPKIDYSFED